MVQSVLKMMIDVTILLLDNS